MSKIEKLREIIRSSSNIVFFGGAGVSTESNIPDFRSEKGLYEAKNNYSYPPEIMLSRTFFEKNTEDFYDFYKNKMIYKNANPNTAHYALAKLEEMGKLKAVITQNIDGLHQKAGSGNVLELHGSVYRNYCIECRKFYNLNYILSTEEGVPICNECGGVIKPDVVLYEEALKTSVINQAIHYIENADVLIIGGTSLVVYPAANLIRYYKGKKLILINKSSTSYDGNAYLIINESIGEVLGDLVREW